MASDARTPGGAPRDATRGVVIFTVILALVMIFPIFAIGNRVEPFVLGLPFSLFWAVFWIAFEFVGLVAFYRYEYGGKDTV